MRVRAERLHDIGADGDVGHEMAVHHVDMDPVGAGRIDRAHLLAEPGEIGGKDRGRDYERKAHRSVPACLLRVSCALRASNAKARSAFGLAHKGSACQTPLDLVCGHLRWCGKVIHGAAG